MTYETNLNNIPKNFLIYLRFIVFNNIGFYKISKKDIIQMWNDTENKEEFKDKDLAWIINVNVTKCRSDKMSQRLK